MAKLWLRGLVAASLAAAATHAVAQEKVTYMLPAPQVLPAFAPWMLAQHLASRSPLTRNPIVQQTVHRVSHAGTKSAPRWQLIPSDVIPRTTADHCSRSSARRFRPAAVSR